MKGALGGISSVVMQAVKIGLGAFMGKMLGRMIDLVTPGSIVTLMNTTLTLSTGWTLLETEKAIGPITVKSYIVASTLNLCGFLADLLDILVKEKAKVLIESLVHFSISILSGVLLTAAFGTVLKKYAKSAIMGGRWVGWFKLFAYLIPVSINSGLLYWV